jgi:3D (Asp-Asp-Asp) domain-containing protein
MDTDKIYPLLFLKEDRLLKIDRKIRRGQLVKYGIASIILLISLLIVIDFWPYYVGASFSYLKEVKNEEQTNIEEVFDFNSFILIQGNTINPLYFNIENNPKYYNDIPTEINGTRLVPKQKINVVLTAYSSTPWETQGNPYITASGSYVRDGIVASNLLDFGTKIRIPEVFGDKVFVVEDRMNPKKGYYHIDIWMPSYSEAVNFGVKKTYIEILE